jgi:hypothetical protein
MIVHYNTPYANHTFVELGVHMVTLRVYDPSFNWGEASFRVTALDVTPPVAVASIDAAVDQYAPFHLDGSRSTDNVGIVSWSWTIFDANGPHHLEAKRTSYAFPLPGRFQVTLKVTDAAGNWDIAYKNVTVVDASPPVVDVPVARTVDLGGEIRFDIGNSTDDSGHVTLSQIEPGDESIVPVGDDTCRFTKVGTFPLWLTLSDGWGHAATAKVVVTVVDRVPPHADAGPDMTAIEGTVVTLDGTGSTDNAGIVTCSWWSADCGFSASGSRVDLMAPSLGTFVVTLTVTDASNNTAVDNVTVTFLSRDLYLLLGPFHDADGKPVDDVDVRVTLNGTTYRWTTNSTGWTTVQVTRTDLVQSVAIVATKPGWERLEHVTALDADGRPVTEIPPMVREAGITGGPSPLVIPTLVIVVAVTVLVTVLVWRRTRTSR